jgi:hypothetical protein
MLISHQDPKAAGAVTRKQCPLGSRREGVKESILRSPGPRSRFGSPSKSDISSNLNKSEILVFAPLSLILQHLPSGTIPGIEPYDPNIENFSD